LAPRNDVGHTFAISPRVRASFAVNIPPSKIRGRRECRALDAPAASRVEKNTRVSHHGHTGITRHSPRNGFNGFLRALPGESGFLVTVASGVAATNLNAGVEASGPHDFAVRKHAHLSEAPPASTASRPTFVTIAKRPSEGRDDSVYCCFYLTVNYNFGNSEIYAARGWLVGNKALTRGYRGIVAALTGAAASCD
jgi:hypothetical protein